MAQTCSKCSRVNPAEASYCYYDGSLLEGHSANGGAGRGGMHNFPTPFHFPSGLICRNFDQLAQGCQENWPQALELMQQGYLENFLGGLGRADLAFAAREAARFPDRDRGLDQLLAKLPSQVLEPPKLRVEPTEMNLGLLQVGDNRQLDLQLVNDGSRLFYGTVTVDDCKWLALGEAPGTAQKVFQFGNETSIPVQVRGANLRAGAKPLEGRLLVESNGGTSAVLIRCEVPVKAFPDGVLAGARSPRQIAEKAKAAPKEAAGLFEHGGVADWYKSNGWTYPVQGPSANGLGAVQQFFEALGLTQPPKVDINEKVINFQGLVGANLRHMVEVKAQEKRPVFAHGVSDQPWLVVERAQLSGRTATLAITVPSVPNRSGEILQGKVTITANGNQRFVVPVNLTITGGGYPPPVNREEQIPVFANLYEPAAVPVMPAVPAFGVPVAQVAAGRPPAYPEAGPASIPVVLMGQAPPRRPRVQKTSAWTHMLPLFALAAVLLGMVIHDFFAKSASDEADAYPVNPDPQLEVLFMDGPIKTGRKDLDESIEKLLGERCLRFGIIMPNIDDPIIKNEKDSRTQDAYRVLNPTEKKRLTFNYKGVSNNTCIMIDGAHGLLGSPPQSMNKTTLEGQWVTNKNHVSLFTLSNPKTRNDGPPGRVQRQRLGKKAIFDYDNGIRVTQTVEVIPNPSGQPVSMQYEGKILEMLPLDTVIVKYEIENLDKNKVPHQVGLRFLLDTFIGSNDGVPFLIPGKKNLCNTQEEFQGQQIPDFIQALEFPSLEETQRNKDATIARLTLRLPGLEPPERVTLGAWPSTELGTSNDNFLGFMTSWNVPVKSIQDPYVRGDQQGKVCNDSAVTMYWEPKELKAGEKRVVGFAYGLGDLSSSASGAIGLVTGGNFAVGQEITVLAQVTSPQPGETATISLGPGLELVEGAATQEVPPLPPNETSNTSPVTWRVKITVKGAVTIGIKRSTGGATTKRFIVHGSAGTF